MKKNIIIIIFVLLTWGCSKEQITPPNYNPSFKNTPVIVDGTIFYFEGGGTVEMQLPAGIQLIHSRWILPSAKSDTGFSIYLSGTINASYFNKQIRVFGILDSIMVSWMFTTSKTRVLKIDVDSMRVIN